MTHLHAEHAILKSQQVTPVKTYDIGPCRDLGELPLHPRLIESRSRHDEYDHNEGHEECDEDSNICDADSPAQSTRSRERLRGTIPTARARRLFGDNNVFQAPEPIMPSEPVEPAIPVHMSEMLDDLLGTDREAVDDISGEDECGGDVEAAPEVDETNSNPYTLREAEPIRWTVSAQSPSTLIHVSRAQRQYHPTVADTVDFHAEFTTMLHRSSSAESDTVLNAREPGTAPSEPPSENVREEMHNIADLIRRAVGTSAIGRQIRDYDQ